MFRNAVKLMVTCLVGACAVTPSTGPVQDEMEPPAVSSLEAKSVVDAAGDENLLSCPAAHSCDHQLYFCPTTWSDSILCDTQCTTQVCAEGNIEKDFASQQHPCTPLFENLPPCGETRIVTSNSCGC